MNIQHRTTNIETRRSRSTRAFVSVVSAGFSIIAVTTFAKMHSRFALRTNLVSSRPVQKLATPHKLTDASPLSRKDFRSRFALSVLFLAALWFGLCRELSGEWSVNEQYNFGWFVPFFALYLFWLRWQDRPPTQISNRNSQIANSAALAMAIAALLLLLPVRLFEIANPEWRLLAWVHAAAVVTLTLLLLWWAGGKAWLRHFAFPVAFIFVAVPWPTSLETPVIQGLMRIVARVAAETAMLLGTPAQVEGNLDSREQRPCRRERSVQRHSFVADVAHDRPALRRSETTLSVTTPGARCVRRCHCASRQFSARGFSGHGCRD